MDTLCYTARIYPFSVLEQFHLVVIIKADVLVRVALYNCFIEVAILAGRRLKLFMTLYFELKVI